MRTAYLAMLLLTAAPALAQNEEIIVTGSRRAGSLQAPEVQLPAITLRRAADFAAAEARIAAFIKAVPAAGRAALEASGEPSLSVVNPSQYRAAIIDLITADAKATAARMGPEYGANLQGPDRPVQWGPGAPGEVALFLPYVYQVSPRPR